MDKSPLKNGRAKGNNNRGMRNVGFTALLILIALVILAALNQPNPLHEVSATEAINNTNKGDYTKIVDNNGQLVITEKGKDKPTLRANVDPNASLKAQGFDVNKAQVSYKPESTGGSNWVNLASTIIPLVLFGGLMYFMLRSAQGQGNQALSFGKSRARLYGNEKDKVPLQ